MNQMIECISKSIPNVMYPQRGTRLLDKLLYTRKNQTLMFIIKPLRMNKIHRKGWKSTMEFKTFPQYRYTHAFKKSSKEFRSRGMRIDLTRATRSIRHICIQGRDLYNLKV